MKVLTPAIAGTHTINGILVKVFLKDEARYDGFKILLSNRESATFFIQQKFNIEGSFLEASNNPTGYYLYRLRLTEQYNLEDDPLLRCRQYPQLGDFDSCLERSYILQTSNIANCSPPWLTARQELWCPPLITLSPDQRERLDVLLDNIVNNQDNRETTDSCPKSCRQTM